MQQPKGLYIARIDLDQPHLMGVARKIEAQLAALSGAGLPARLLCLRDGAIELDGEIAIPPGGSGWTRRINHHWRFHKAMERAARDAAFLYIRFQGAPPGFVSALARLKRARPKLPVLLEIPTWPYRDERRGPRAHLLGAFEDSGLGKLLGSVDRIVTFSRSSEIFGIGTLQSDNGVEPAHLPAPASAPPEPPLRLVAVANLGVRHAYDRMIAGLAGYGGLQAQRPVALDIVGTGSSEAELRALVRQNGLEGQVTFCGPLNGADLDARLAQAHIGIASLGMHRINADTSDLKSREYCARGLPFVTGNPDRDFPKEFPFAFHVPPDDSPIDIAALIEWHDGLRAAFRDLPAKMRKYAEENLTWQMKFRCVTEWLSEAVAIGRPH